MMQKITIDAILFANPGDTPRSRKCLLAIMHAVVFINRTWLDTYPKTPALYTSGVLYKAETTEFWQDIPTCIKTGLADCEDLACWRIAELNQIGIKAKPYVKWRNSGPKKNVLHALVEWPDGRVEDPSLALGMGGGPILAKPIFVDPGPKT